MDIDPATRRDWLRRVQSVGLVTLIAAVIWLYAEGQDVREITREVRLTLPAEVGQSTVVAFANPAQAASVQVHLMGASASLSQVEQQLGAGEGLRLPVEPGDLRGGGPATLDLASLIRRARVRPDQPTSPTLMDLGISVLSVEPAELRVEVDQLVEKRLRVLFDPGVVDVEPDWGAEPAEVGATLLRSRWEAVREATDALFVEAVVPRGTLLALEEGVRQRDVQADLRLPEVFVPAGPLADYTRLHRRTVSLSFTIARQRAVAELGTVPVWLVSSPSELQRYRVELAADNRVLNGVRIEGSRDLIERLKAEDSNLRVIARFELTSEELDRGASSTPLTAIEIQEVVNGRRRVQAVVPLNPGVLQPGVTAAPTFVSTTPDIRITVPSPIVNFEVTPREP